MNIGIELDGVLTNVNSFIKENGKKYYNNNPLFINELSSSFQKMFNCSKQESETFWKKHMKKYCLNVDCERDASEVIRKLKEDGNNIYIITSRPFITEQSLRGNYQRLLLKKWLYKNNIICDGIIYCNRDNNIDEIYQACKQFNIDLMFENQIVNAISISRISDVIMMERPYNIGFNIFDRVPDFSTLYKEISNRYHRKEIHK